MIGGTMLMCAVGAMILIAMWSLKRDEDPDAMARDGLLALRTFGNASGRRVSQSAQRQRRPGQRRSGQRRTAAPHVEQTPFFDPDEMAAIEAEAQATLPDFVHRSREEY